MTTLMRGLGLAALLVCATACGVDVLPPSPPAALPILEIVSGNGQQGTLGELLAEPLVIRVIDAKGAGVPGIPVRWTASVGAGEFGVLGAVTPTAADGRASISFRPTGINASSTVTVTAATAGLTAGPVNFTFQVTAPLHPDTVLIPFGPLFDCTGGNDPSRFVGPEGTIAVGTVVVWEYAPWLYPVCAAQLRSVSVPPGGTFFESGLIHPGEHFAAVLGVAGDWVVKDVMYGGEVTLRVR